MSDLDELVSITVSVNNTGIPAANFFTPMILSHNAAFSDRIRFYTSLLGVAADFPVTTSPEYLAAQDLFGQTPHPAQIAIGRATVSVTMAYQVSPIVSAAGQTYAINVAGQGVTPTLCSYTPGADIALTYSAGNIFTTAVANGMSLGDGPYRIAGTPPTGAAINTNYWIVPVTPTTFSIASSKANALSSTVITLSGSGSGLSLQRIENDVICAQLVQQLNLVTGANYTAAQSGSSGSQVVTVTGNVANAWFSISVTDSTMLNNKMTQTGDPTADLNAIIAAATSANFYQLITLYNSQTYVLAAAAWVEANSKTYIVAHCDNTDINTATTGSSGLGDTLNSHGYTRTLWMYHPTPADTLDAALSGRIVSINPGLWTAAFKTLAGPVPTNLTATQRTNLKARRGNCYVTRAGRAVTLYGTVGSPVYGFLDIVVGLDYFTNQIQTQVYGVLAGANKIGYSDTDIAQIVGAINGCIADSVSDAHKIISAGTPGSSSDPVPSIVFPQVASISPSQRALRNLPNGVLTARLLGAVQSIALTATITF